MINLPKKKKSNNKFNYLHSHDFYLLYKYLHHAQINIFISYVTCISNLILKDFNYMFNL